MRTAQGSVPRASIIRSFNLGVIGMSGFRSTLAAAALSLATLVPAGYAAAADLPVKAKVKPIADVPFERFMQEMAARNISITRREEAW